MPTLNKIDLLIYLAIWRRPEITELCLIGIERLKKHPAYNIQVAAVISETEMIPLCEKHNVKWIMHQNLPLGKKKNYGLKACSEFDFDYLMEIGSDDLITNEMLDQYLNYFGKYDFFGISDMAYIESESLECRRLTNKSTTYGAGRCIKKDLLVNLKWNIWTDELNRGLDNDSIRRIEKNGYKFHKVDSMDVPGLIDIKSNENIWKFNYFLGQEYDINNILSKLSSVEISKLNSLSNVSA
jgi:hypothetical protein